jgi:tagatose-6-phosphate ketose/aldose isomerase
MPLAPTAHSDGGATVVEIEQQPGAWHDVADGLDPRAVDRVRSALQRPDTRVVLTGAGSSAFGGQIVAPALRRQVGRRVDAVPTTSIVANPRDHLERETPTLLVSFARSGNSPESLAATRLADELIDDVTHVIVTCDATGELARVHSARADSIVLLMPERTNDTGFAMTSSLTSMMVACLLLFGAADAAAIDALAAAARHIIDNRDAIRHLAATTPDRFVYLGSGALEALARESALKLLELTAGEVVTYFDSPLGFRHGPKSVLDDRTLAVVYVSNDPYTRRYDLDMIVELRAALGDSRVVTITADPTSADAHWLLPDCAGVDDSTVAIAYLVFAQYLALDTALARGKTPDNPFPAGEVNRVVQGVTIHPLEEH